MTYKNFKNIKISQLGFGAMRLPNAENAGWGGSIDEAAAMDMIANAYNNGINYFDTAYFYHGGASEEFLGRALARFPRDTWYLANKMPGNLMRLESGKLVCGGNGMEARQISGPGEIFEYQLNRCSVDYFDFYLLHNISESTYNTYTNEDIGIVDYLLEQKKAGRIKHTGFSAHGRAETIEKFLQYLKDTNRLDFAEFIMIQINYLDAALQEAVKKYDVITGYGIPVFAMEPVRGGKLCRLGDENEALLKAAKPDYSQAAWAFRYLQSFENIPVILSGMSSMEQLKENIGIFDVDKPLTQDDKALLGSLASSLAELAPCTDCRYCLEACPQQLNIPALLSMYNEGAYEVSWTLRATLGALAPDKKPSACTACGLCAPLCPQDINIPDALQKFAEILTT